MIVKKNIKITTLKNSKPKKAFSLIEISITLLIIGLLIAGISKASDMITESKLKSARAITKSSPVTRLNNLVLWIETTATESWSDGFRYDGAQASRTLKDINPQVIPPDSFSFGSGTITYKQDAYNSLPSISLGSVISSSSARSSSSIFDINSNGFTIFAVVKPQMGTTATPIISFEESTPASNKKIVLQYSAASATTYKAASLIYPASAETTTTSDVVSSIVDKKIEVITAQADATKATIFSNGNGFSASTAVPYKPIAIDGLFKIGSGVEIFEIIIVGERLNDSTRKRIEQYLFKKWNIPSDKLLSSDNF